MNFDTKRKKNNMYSKTLLINKKFHKTFYINIDIQICKKQAWLNNAE